MLQPEYDMVLIGGSAGSLPVIAGVLQELRQDFNFTIVIVVHRLKNVNSEMGPLLSVHRGGLYIREPEDKEPVRKQCVYLAPQNYHLLVEDDHSFSLDYSELVHYSRPALDVTFESAAAVYGSRCIGIVLSGANRDGADGLRAISEAGGRTLVQDPATAEYDSMPNAAIAVNPGVQVMTPDRIIEFIRSINC